MQAVGLSTACCCGEVWMKRINKKVWVVLLLMILIGGMFAVWMMNHGLKRKADLSRLENEEYDTVFLSMFPTDYYEEGDWTYFRAMDIVKTSYEIPNVKVLRKYMETIGQSANVVTTVYLGLDPTVGNVEDIVLLIQEHPETFFEIILEYPQIEYWKALSEKRCEERLQSYVKACEGLLLLENARVYLVSGQEWLICNPSNYTTPFCTNTEVSQFLMCNFDYLHPYLLTVENWQERIEDMKTVIQSNRTGEISYPDAKQVQIVFFGDSIIGNYTNSMSVPEVAKALSKAEVFNCGYGGRGAALCKETEISFPEIVDAFIAQDMNCLPEGTQLYDGVKMFIERENTDRELMFVINYGLNDYYNGAVLESENMYDITSYGGALRGGIEKIKKEYPDAQIVLMTPNFTTYFDYGQGRNSEAGGVLEEYAELALEIARQQQVGVLDNYHELPITKDNWKDYQDDGCHLNERGRFLLGSRIARIIKTDK